MEGGLNRELNMQYQLDLGQRQEMRQIRDRSAHIQVNETNGFVENRFPMEQLLGFSLPIYVALRNGLIEHDRA
jgi:hypothetical protein